MSDTISFDVTLANKIKRALIRNNIPDAADLDWLAAGDNIAKVRKVRLGYSEIVHIEHVIDLRTIPYVPEGWNLDRHYPGGLFKWAPENVQLYFDIGQLSPTGIDGFELAERLHRRRVLNANVLDYLLTHPHLIPEDWKRKQIYFWGSIYSNGAGTTCVRQLSWRVDGWDSSFSQIAGPWRKYDLAVLDVSTD